MTETEKAVEGIYNIPLPKDEKQILKMRIDESGLVASKNKEINALNEKIGQQSEIIKSMLKNDHEQFIKTDAKEPTISTETANLENEPTSREYKNKQTTIYKNVDFANSNVLDLMKFDSPKKAIEHLKMVASNPQDPDYQQANEILNKAIKKELSQGGDYELKGNICRFERRGNYIIETNKKAEFIKIDKGEQ